MAKKDQSRPLRHFLLVFDHKAGKLLSHDEYRRPHEALEAYRAAEEQYDATDWVEVVLVGSDSFDTVRQTHANYFDGTAALAHALARILSERIASAKDDIVLRPPSSEESST